MIGWVLFLFFLGVFLILAEFIVPGGICGIVGGAFILASCGLGVYHFPGNGFMIIFIEGLATLACILVGLYIFPKTFIGKIMILQSNQNADEGWVSDVTDESLRGATGEAFTKLRPAGTILVDGKRISAVTNGGYIEQGAAIRVVEVNGNHIVVEKGGADDVPS